MADQNNNHVRGAFLNTQGGVTLCQSGREAESLGFAGYLWFHAAPPNAGAAAPVECEWPACECVLNLDKCKAKRISPAATPAVPVPALTDEQIIDICETACGWLGTETDARIVKFARAVLASQGVPAPDAAPIQMILHCPSCHLQHIDAPESCDMVVDGVAVDTIPLWDNPPHKSHLCHGCGHIWRPADAATEGVKTIQTRGKADSPALDVGGLTEQQAHVMPPVAAPVGQHGADSVVVEIPEWAWSDERTVEFDSTVMFGMGYDFFGLESFAQELRTAYGTFLIWPNRDHRGENWSIYFDRDGRMWFEQFADEATTKACVARQIAALEAGHLARVADQSSTAGPAKGGITKPDTGNLAAPEATSEQADFVMPTYTPPPPLNWNEESSEQMGGAQVAIPDELMQACRRALVSLAHAAEKHGIYQRDYDNFAKAVESFAAPATGAQVAKDGALTARVCGITPGMGKVELLLPGDLPEWAELGCAVSLSPTTESAAAPVDLSTLTRYEPTATTCQGEGLADMEADANGDYVLLTDVQAILAKSRAAEGAATSERKPLTEPEIIQMVYQQSICATNYVNQFAAHRDNLIDLARAIEQHHGIGSDK